MKKTLALLLALAMCLSLCACGSSSGEKTPAETTEPPVSLEAIGASVAIEKIKEYLKDPNSLELVSVDRVPYLAFYIYRIEYTATNSFGGRVRGEAFVGVYIDEANNTAKLSSKFEHYSLTDSAIQKAYKSGLDEVVEIDIDSIEY